MTYCEGFKITDAAAMETAGLDRDRVMRAITESFAYQVRVWGLPPPLIATTLCKKTLCVRALPFYADGLRYFSINSCNRKEKNSTGYGPLCAYFCECFVGETWIARANFLLLI